MEKGICFLLHYLGKIVLAKGAHIWMHLTFPDTHTFENDGKRSAYGRRHMHMFPAALANLCFFHIVGGPFFWRKLNVSKFCH